MAVLQYSRLVSCRNCLREVRLVRDIENAATPKTTANWMCPTCGHRAPASQHLAYVAGEYSLATPSTEMATPQYQNPWTLATPDLGGYDSVVKPV